MKTLTATTLAALILATPLAARPAFAQALLDPTRPPASLGTSLDAPGSAGDGLPRLQSVLIAPRVGGRQVAVIDGETVRLGDMFKGARVAHMSQSEVVLVRGRERQVLRLEPAPAEAAGNGIARAN